MKFIFPQNYNLKNKILGFIDYSTAIFNVCWYIIVFIIINLLFDDLNIKIFLFIFLCFPILLFSLYGFNGENFIYAFSYFLSSTFLSSRLLFLFIF